MPEVGFSPNDPDAALADFAHRVGHQCAACRAIRRLGPAGIRNALSHLMSHALGRVVTEEEAAAVDPRQLKKLVKLKDKRRRRMNDAYRGKPVRVRTRAA